MGSFTKPDIKLYTNHGCPWAHRAHITLAELGLPFEEVIIDLDTPRTPEYLKVNPRGLVPALEYNGEIITESAVVTQFLADAHPSSLVPTSTDPKGPLSRARIAFFVDAWFSKVNSLFFKTQLAKTEAEAEGFAKEAVAAIIKEIEPLLGNAGPFFGGSEKLTLAEALTGPFILRFFSLAKHGVVPNSLVQPLQEQTPNFYTWAQHVIKHPSVTSIFNEEKVVERTKARIAKLKA